MLISLSLRERVGVVWWSNSANSPRGKGVENEKVALMRALELAIYPTIGFGAVFF